MAICNNWCLIFSACLVALMSFHITETEGAVPCFWPSNERAMCFWEQGRCFLPLERKHHGTEGRMGQEKSDPKLPNVSSETALETRLASGCWVLAADDWLPATCFVTAGYSLLLAASCSCRWLLQKRRSPNVSSETNSIKKASPQMLSPGCWRLAACYLLLSLLLAASCSCRWLLQNVGPGQENTMALKDGWARKKWPNTA